MTDLTERWVNIYKSKKHGSYWTGAFCYKTKEEAVKNLADKEHYLTTVNIEDMLNLQTQNAQLKELLKKHRDIFARTLALCIDLNFSEKQKNQFADDIAEIDRALGGDK